jgi:transcriptional regulator with XRE-family HTH domain
MSNDDKELRFLNSLAKRIAELRKGKHMSQEVLAEEAGIDRVALANIETGKRRPLRSPLVHRLAEQYGLEPFRNLLESNAPGLHGL